MINGKITTKENIHSVSAEGLCKLAASLESFALFSHIASSDHQLIQSTYRGKPKLMKSIVQCVCV